MAVITVAAAEFEVSRNPKDVLITHSLGSCIAVVLYDPAVKVAGLLHFMLPDSALDVAKATQHPSMFADTGIPLLLHRAALLGATRSRMVCMAAGGASMLQQNESFNVGQRNYLALATTFHAAGIRLKAHDIGGSNSRTLRIDVARGRVRIRKPGGNEEEIVICMG